MSEALVLTGQPLTLEEIGDVALRQRPVVLGEEARARVLASRRLVDALVERNETAYGINTGFGKLSDVRIPPDQLQALQRNLVRSHACGIGEPLPEATVRAMLLLRANVLAKGHSGVRPVVIEMLLGMLAHGLHPVVPSRGSVGASGDLAPLAHLALGLIGEGFVFAKGQRMAAREALTQAGLEPLALEAKEGLALLNGTQAMTAVGALALERALRVTQLFDLAGGMSLDALRGTPAAFDERIHLARPHPGQLAAARHLRALLEDSEIRESHRTGDPRVQDAYCLRCMPQVHGAARGALAHVREVIEIESGSATDNPLVFSADSRSADSVAAGSGHEAAEILSGGNFHGAPLAMAFDYAAIALTDLMSISERRVDRLVNPDINEGLPPFLSTSPGVSSGLMIAHVAAAALLNESKVLSHPASVDSVPTSGGKEDHVSMGMTAALKLEQIVGNAEHLLAIELMSAAQGLDYRQPLRPARALEAAQAVVREFVAPLTSDRELSSDIAALAAAIRAGSFDRWRS
ncbi:MULTISPECIES: histidine ammonia-lyase [Acidobacterium]|uniref:Histidine ammonia-lyase n=1 Tax=Acidobacterium capsulatum (strain ATCC 51196 / DSM 11244 / BCRC 80197 / JCM 7670 / NBRC 15755 / NCIMB 13165 / 161) TaxID=240015 RepID=C1F4I3_ACIC5|nr:MULTISPECIES: histidine ammonia-lyase [Acidobacterium]ACO31371.1 histidine ammonia-lyase [Acidobacterium capsulatum ATCC 51196]HCT61805.1 histidine ammonia-lyase [Acidobacterium sp.]